MGNFKIFAINPGSTSTKVAMFEDDVELFSTNVKHAAEDLEKFDEVADQFEYRFETILSVLKSENHYLEGISAVACRGGAVEPCEGGVYEVTPKLIKDSLSGKIAKHPAMLGCAIGDLIAKKFNVKAYIVNPPDVDEFEDIARVTGFADVYRGSQCHALNQKQTAITAATEMGKKYGECNFVVCHIGGGVSVAAHKKGRIVDSNSIIKGEGPLTSTRSGSMPLVPFMDLCYSGKWTRDEMYARLTKNGGLVDLMGTSDNLEVFNMACDGNEYAQTVLDTFIYQIAKNVGAMAAVLHGDIDAILLTGGVANDKVLMKMLTERIGFLAPVRIYPGEFEMEALAAGVLRVLNGTENAKEYTGIPVWQGFEKDC